jgi:hypothetical protein
LLCTANFLPNVLPFSRPLSSLPLFTRGKTEIDKSALPPPPPQPSGIGCDSGIANTAVTMGAAPDVLLDSPPDGNEDGPLRMWIRTLSAAPVGLMQVMGASNAYRTFCEAGRRGAGGRGEEGRGRL